MEFSTSEKITKRYVITPLLLSVVVVVVEVVEVVVVVVVVIVVVVVLVKTEWSVEVDQWHNVVNANALSNILSR